MTTTRLDNSRNIRSPRGSELTAKSWLTEAPMRMLMNNLDAEVAEKPGELVVYSSSMAASAGRRAPGRVSTASSLH